MKKLIKILCLLAIAILLVMPVGGAVVNITPNDTSFQSHTYKTTENYLRFEYLVLLIGIGLSCLAISRIWESTEDLFSVMSVIPLAVSAWFSNYTTFESANVVGTQIVFSTVVTPNAYLSLAMVIATICAVLNVIWIFLLKPADVNTDSDKKEV